jgi:hypothetical protein
MVSGNNRLIYFLSFAISIIIFGCSNPTKPIVGFSNYLHKNGYSFYNPPREGRGAGHAFIVKESISGKKSVSPICKRVFRDIDVSKEPIELTKEEKLQTFSINFFVDFNHDLLNSSPKLMTDLKKEIKILAEIQNPIEHVIYEEDLYDNDGTPRTLTPQCYAALKNKKVNDELEDVYFVQSAVETDKVIYTFQSESLNSTDLEAEIKKMITFNLGNKFSTVSKNQLIIEKPRYIAFIAYQMEHFIPTGHMGGFTAKIKLNSRRSIVFEEYTPYME